MKEYHIRFNTKHNNETPLVWRVFEDGVEHLVKSLNITVPVTDSTTIEFGETKWNISCKGTMTIIDDVAHIR
jgi:hypothetical protein